MNRVEELTQKALDGNISAEEDRELHLSFTADPANWKQYLQLLAVEIELRNLNEAFDVSDAVMTQLDARPTPARAPQAAKPAMARATAPPRAKGQPSLGWLLRLILPFGVAALLVFGFVHFKDTFKPAVATASAQSAIHVVRGGGAITLARGDALRPLDKLVLTNGAEAAFQYDDGTRVRIASESELIIGATLSFKGSPSKSIYLRSGMIEVTASEQPKGRPMVLKTPDAFAIVRGTKFNLFAGPKNTRLSVHEGAVDLERLSDAKTVTVTAGYFADVGANSDMTLLPLRSTDKLGVLYTFEESKGKTVFDRSGYGEPIDLFASGKYPDSGKWLPEGGFMWENAGYWKSEAPAKKMVAACRESRALTVEAWLSPTRIQQSGPARIVTVSLTSHQVNFQLAHDLGSGANNGVFLTRLRTTKTDTTGNPALHTPSGSVQTRLMHVVYTHDADGKQTFYIDGKKVSSAKVAGDFTNWVDGFRLALGNDVGGENKFWEGRFHLVALYYRALSQEDIERQYTSGPRHFVGFPLMQAY